MSARLAFLLAAAVLGLAVPAAALAFDNLEPLAAKQWYLDQDQAWSFWPTEPKLAPVRVAVIDSGIDGSHPEFVGRVVAARSFVGGSPYHDEQGHGTFVAGEIAANPFNKEGIAGLAFNAQLMIAKVVGANGIVSLDGEVAAIHWAVDNGARVINLSLGGVRDPLDPRLDTYSPLEQAAIDYAYSKGAVIVAAVGNGEQSPALPWNFAHYPAALPHVIGVSAIRQNGSVPEFSNRDAIYNDIAAPGDAMFSTIPQPLVDASVPGCAGHPYSDCGPAEFRGAIGTSFAAPQVSAAAALLLGEDPALHPDQVASLLERSADDATAGHGLPDVRGRSRSLQRLGNARHRERAAESDDRTDSRCRPLRAERQRRPVGARAAAAAPDDHCDARLLGRQHRRLPRPSRSGTAPLRACHPGHGRVGPHGLVGARHGASRRPRRAAAAADPVP